MGIVWRCRPPRIGPLITKPTRQRVTVGVVAAFGVNALSFFVSAACLIPVLPHSRPPAPGGARVSTFQSIREGIAWIRERPWLWLTIAAAARAN